MNHQYKSYMTGIILAAMTMPTYAAEADTAQADMQNLLSKDVGLPMSTPHCGWQIIYRS